MFKLWIASCSLVACVGHGDQPPQETTMNAHGNNPRCQDMNQTQNKVVARLLAEVKRLRGQLLAWRDLVERVEIENKNLRSSAASSSVPCSGADLDRTKTARLEAMLSDACDQNRDLKSAKMDLEAVLDEQDIQIDALQRKIATLEASLKKLPTLEAHQPIPILGLRGDAIEYNYKTHILVDWLLRRVDLHLHNVCDLRLLR